MGNHKLERNWTCEPLLNDGGKLFDEHVLFGGDRGELLVEDA